MSAKLFLFPDTNLFLQCKPLDQVDWRLLGEWDQIELIVTRPVQIEIDSLKGKGNGRQASKARIATSLLRKLLVDGVDHVVISGTPQVHLVVRLNLRPDASAASSLNYEFRDDQLVGTAAGFQNSNGVSIVRLLTDDTGVMFSARTVGLEYLKIPEQWFLPAEADLAEKKERNLKEQIARYEKAEPAIKITLSLGQSNVTEAIESTVEQVDLIENRKVQFDRLNKSIAVYGPLTKEECALLVNMLSERFPKADDFGSTQPAERDLNGTPLAIALFGAEREVFTPATPQEIEGYKSAYINWISESEQFLGNFHSLMNRNISWPLLIASISNNGSRPAEDALVVIEAQGDLGFLRIKKKRLSENESEDAAEVKSGLTRPPSAPTGFWKKTHRYRDIFDLTRGLSGMHLQNPQFDILPPLHHQRPHDPNAFYLKEGRNGIPAKKLALACQQWRHSQISEEFQQHVICPRTSGIHSGLVVVTVHAANLTSPAIATMPATISIKELSCYNLAVQMVKAL